MYKVGTSKPRGLAKAPLALPDHNTSMQVKISWASCVPTTCSPNAPTWRPRCHRRLQLGLKPVMRQERCACMVSLDRAVGTTSTISLPSVVTGLRVKVDLVPFGRGEQSSGRQAVDINHAGHIALCLLGHRQRSSQSRRSGRNRKTVDRCLHSICCCYRRSRACRWARPVVTTIISLCAHQPIGHVFLAPRLLEIWIGEISRLLSQ